MNIYAARGSKVVYLDENGYSGDKKWARDNGLIKGQIYTVSSTEVDSSSSSVWLEEIDDHRKFFNTVMFQDLDEYLEENQENEYQETIKSVPVIPETKFGDFRASAQGKVDFNVEVVNLNGDMAVCTKDGVVYITREQATAFFGIVDRPMNKLLDALSEGNKFQHKLYVPTRIPGSNELEYVLQWLPYSPETLEDLVKNLENNLRVELPVTKTVL